jgi:hypothetical protein
MTFLRSPEGKRDPDNKSQEWPWFIPERAKILWGSWLETQGTWLKPKYSGLY